MGNFWGMRAGEDMAEVFLKTKDVARTIQE